MWHDLPGKLLSRMAFVPEIDMIRTRRRNVFGLLLAALLIWLVLLLPLAAVF